MRRKFFRWLSPGRPLGHLPPEPDRMLGVVRAVIFGVWFLKVATAPLAPLAELPAALFHPLALLGAVPAGAWSRLLRADVLTGFQILVCLAAALAALGIRPYRLNAAAAGVLLTLHQVLVRSFGHVNHQEISLLFAAYALALFPAADAFTPRPRRAPPRLPALYAAPIVLVAALLLLPYAAIAAFRLAHTGRSALAGGSLTGFFLGNSFGHGYDIVGTFVLDHPWFGRAVEWTAPVVAFFEWSAPLALVSRRFRRVWLVFAVSFHLSTGILMHIFFWDSILLAVLILPALDRVEDALRARAPAAAP